MSDSIVTNLKATAEKVIFKYYTNDGLGRGELQGDMSYCKNLLQLDPAIGERIQGHGIDKELPEEQIASLVNLLTNGPKDGKDFHTAPLELPPGNGEGVGSGLGTKDGTAYKGGSFIVISEVGKDIKTAGDIKAVLVNPVLHELIPDLQKQFPGMKFVPYNQINDYLHELGHITSENRAVYNAIITKEINKTLGFNPLKTLK